MVFVTWFSVSLSTYPTSSLVEAWCREQIFMVLLNCPCPSLHKLNVRVNYDPWICLSFLDDNHLYLRLSPPYPPACPVHTHTHTHRATTRAMVTDMSKGIRVLFQPYFWKYHLAKTNVLLSGDQFCHRYQHHSRKRQFSETSMLKQTAATLIGDK